MTYGKLNTLINKINNYINNYIQKEIIIDISSYKNLKNKIYNEYNNDFIKLEIDKNMQIALLNDIFIKLFSISYKFNNNNDNILFENGNNCFREYEHIYDEIIVPVEYREINDKFNKLKNLPQPVQRSQEWFDYRHNRITASDTAAAIDMNPYEFVESFILKKCDSNFSFQDNATVFHGRKYEPIATLIYEHIYNAKIIEFGALPSDKYPFLGASPDGICSKYTLDNKFSPRLGTMLEIKCPVTREITIKGKIDGDICPFYYYCQVQQQLLCCDLNICDFWQCKLSEYSSRNEYLEDDCKSCINTETCESVNLEKNKDIMSYKEININNLLKKGIFLEYYPRNFIKEYDGDNIEWKSKYIIPHRLDMDDNQYNEWILKILDESNILYPDIHNNYYFNKIIYWKLEKSHNASIKRNDTFLLNIIPVLKKTWDDVLYYRNNQDKLNELKKNLEKRKKYIKINTEYCINNKYIIDNNILFLDKQIICNDIIKNLESKNKFQTKSKYKKNNKSNDCDSDYYDFADNNCNFIDSD